MLLACECDAVVFIGARVTPHDTKHERDFAGGEHALFALGCTFIATGLTSRMNIYKQSHTLDVTGRHLAVAGERNAVQPPPLFKNYFLCSSRAPFRSFRSLPMTKRYGGLKRLALPVAIMTNEVRRGCLRRFGVSE